MADIDLAHFYRISEQHFFQHTLKPALKGLCDGRTPSDQRTPSWNISRSSPIPMLRTCDEGTPWSPVGTLSMGLIEVSPEDRFYCMQKKLMLQICFIII